MVLVESDFKPLKWLNNSHLQTLWASLLRRPKRQPARRQRLELPDGDFIDLDWSTNNSDTLVILLHGLEGSLDSNYMQGLFSHCHECGWQSVAFHFRGCSGEPNRLKRAYHSGETSDLDYLLTYLREHHQYNNIFVVGFSLGGNVLLKYLGEDEHTYKPDAAIAVSVPLKLNSVAKKLEKGFSQIYQHHLVSKLKNTIQLKSKLVNLDLDMHKIAKARTFREYDDWVTAPIHGFKNVDDYYQRSSSYQYLQAIKTPTLIVHACDDPFMSDDVFPNEEDLSEKVRFEYSSAGGHVGFISGKLLPKYWLETRIAKYINEHLSK